MKKFFLSKTLFLSSVITLWLVVVAILTDLTEDVVNSEQIVNFDKCFAALFLSWRTDLGVSIFSVVTFLANLEFVLPLAIIILIFLIVKKYWIFVWPFIFTVATAELITFIGKLLIHRTRPEDGALTMLDFSFPSGHATIVVSLYGFLTYFLFIKLKKKTAKIAALIGFISLILIIGFSRLYLGVHYVSDVLAGYLVGLLALLAGISLREWLGFKKPGKNKNNN